MIFEIASSIYSRIRVESSIIEIIIYKQGATDEQSSDVAKLARRKIEGYLSENSDKTFNFIINLLKAGEFSAFQARAAESYQAIIKNAQIKKIVILAKSNFGHLIASSFSSGTGKEDLIKLFTNRDQAVKWLYESE
jgi:hypothetical protein